jgi:drug/metabolite transporter (DMT)-like permease
MLLAFTGVLGKLISIGAEPLVWWRMLIALIGLAVYLLVKGIRIKLPGKTAVKMLLNGVITAAHWLAFFMAIKVSNVSVALICFSATTFFMAFLEPIFLKRKLILYEVLLGLLVICGLYFIFNVEMEYHLGIALGILAAFLGCLFSVINARFIKNHNSVVITTYEMLGGVVALTAYLLLSGDFEMDMIFLSNIDLLYLLILGLVCTSFAFVVMVELMKVLTPFSIAISLNLEPIYAIVLALVVFGQSEHMNPGFYMGSIVIVSAIMLNGYLKNR